MKDWQKAIINAGIMAGISFLSMAVVDGDMNIQTVKAAAVAGGLTFLTLCARYFKAPEDDINDEDEDEIPPSTGGGGKILSMLWL